MSNDIKLENKLLNNAIKDYAIENTDAIKHLEVICEALLSNSNIYDIKCMAIKATEFMHCIESSRNNIDKLSDYLSNKN